MSHIKTLDLKEHKGRVFYSTDVHGHFDLLHEHLKNVAFDSTKDILILGGDNTDRGPDSRYVLDYLNEPWLHCIRANHEQMFINSVEEHFSGLWSRCLYDNGGEWLFDLLDNRQYDLVKAIYEAFKSLPLGIELHLPSETVGIVHAEVPMNDWDQFKAMTKEELDFKWQGVAQWARTNYDRKAEIIVKGVDRVLLGHTPTNSGEVEVLGNCWYCDLGSFFRNEISFIQLM